MDYTQTMPIDYYGNTAGFGGPSLMLWFLIWVLMVVALWKVFVKAGEKGWKSLIPVYNVFILLKIIGKPWWWLILLFVPFVNLVIYVLMYLQLAKAFGKSTIFGLGLIILPFIFMMILGFGSAKYTKAVQAAPVPSQTA